MLIHYTISLVLQVRSFFHSIWPTISQEWFQASFLMHHSKCLAGKVRGSWGRRLLAVAGEVTRHGWAHPYSWLIINISLRSKESEECHRSQWKTKLLSMFLAVRCQHASGACQSHSRLVLNLREASRKYVELSPSNPLFLTLRFYKKDLTLTPNLLRISGQYSLRLGISFQSPQGHSGDWVSRMIL